MTRIRTLLPDILTGINICIGLVCLLLIVNASRDADDFHYYYILSGWLIIFAALVDILDGAIARWLGKTDVFGVQFDSIADYTAFAVAPSVLLYAFVYARHSIVFAIFPLLYLVSAAYRLARFNTDALEASRKKILGLGTPISTAIIVAVVLLIADLHKQNIIQSISPALISVISVIILMNAFLMILPSEFITAYEYCFGNTRRIILLIVAIITPLLLFRFRLMALSILLVGIMYVVESLGRSLVRRRTSKTINTS